MAYFKDDGKFIYLDKEYAEFYIPESYFKESGGFAIDLGEIIKTSVVFDIAFFENGEVQEYKVFNVPTEVDLFVIDKEEKVVNLPREEEPIPCLVLMYQKGHRVMNSDIIMNSDHAQSYANFILKGKVPPIIPYSKTMSVWQKNIDLNNVDLGVPSVMKELVLSVCYRWKQNPSFKFSHIIGKDPTVSEYDYVMNNIRQICQYTSTFNGMTFEDKDTMITTSLNRTREKGNEAYSPIEMLLTL